MKHLLATLATALVALCFTPPARAQFGGQPGMQPGMGPSGGEEPVKEGPAEAAPEEDEEPSDLEPLGGYPGQSRRARQVIELDGYLRLRSDLFHKLHLDQTYVDGDQRTPPYPLPLECPVAETRCGSKNLANGNLRLRVSPTINITDQVRVLAEIDVFDNTLMGSTPESLLDYQRPGLRSNPAPSSALNNSQVPPEVGRNGLVSSIRAKRAWGEVESEFGSLRFGRMPWHFGRGIAYNNGNCMDCDYGTTVDRIIALSQLYGHMVAFSWDFGAQGYHSGMINLGLRDPNGVPVDLSQRDDVLQLMAAINKMDDERAFQDRSLQGELMFNYGAQVTFRKLGHEVYDLSPDQTGSPMSMEGALTREGLAESLTTDVDALIFLPSLWLKLAWKSLTIEAETSAVLGKIGNAGPLSTNASGERLTLAQLGWVVATELRLYRNNFLLGFETGGATGDQAEDPTTYLNYRWKFVPQPAGDTAINNFHFSPDYHVDEILFRRIMGTVTNALYLKPQMTYWLDMAEQRQIGLSAAVIYSMALEPVSTPGNAFSYGIESNLSLTYRNPASGFYAGLTWAVLWPMSALNRPVKTSESGGLWSVDQDATSSQALRTFLGIRF